MRFIVILILILAGLLTISCSSDNPLANEDAEVAQPPAFSTVPDLVIAFPAEFSPEVYDTVEIEYLEETILVYPLEQLIPAVIVASVNLEDPIDQRPLYAYHVKAADFDPRDRSHIIADLHWTIFSQGHFLPDPINRVYFSLLPSYLSAYNVRNPELINVYRKIDVIIAEEEPVMYETDAMQKITVEYNDQTVEAILLSDFITDYLTTTPGYYNFILTDLYDQQYILSWEQMESGYFIPVNDLAIFFTTENSYPVEEIVINHLYSIQLYEN